MSDAHVEKERRTGFSVSTAAQDQNTSPFEMPTLECRDCGRTDAHTYCIRWMERLHLWFTRRAES